MAAQNIDVRVIREHDGRWAARSNALATCIGYGTTEAEARTEFETVRRELTEAQSPPKLAKEANGRWIATSTMYPECVGRGETPAKALVDVRRDEACAFGADYEDWSGKPSDLF